jgi:anti-sigma B factor antagonist
MSNDNPIEQTEPLADGALMKLRGEIDLSQSPEVRVGLLELAKAKPARLVVDLTDVSYMDSSGVATLVEALQQQRKHNGQMILCGLQPKVRSIFEIARLNLVFTIVEDRAQAIEA